MAKVGKSSINDYIFWSCFLYAVAFVHSEKRLNLTNLLDYYVKVCGVDYLCDKTLVKGNPKPDFIYEQLQLCPICMCDDMCVQMGDCCPDLLFSLPEMKCDDMYILDPLNLHIKDNSPIYEVVSSCPHSSSSILNKLCRNSDSDLVKQLTMAPVVGQNFSITYRNKYCAQCNNEHNFTEWNLDIECENFADFNFLNTFEEIIEQAKEKHCGIKFIPGSLPFHVCKKESDYENKIINKCNETGQWAVYDDDVAKACESTYENTYRIFKNIFCYICNPSVHKKKEIIISECNATGFWRPYDLGLDHSCFHYGLSGATRPFKNIFCYLCNRDNTNADLFHDMSTSILEKRSFETPNNYSYYIITRLFKTKLFNYTLNKMSSNDSVFRYSNLEFERILPNGQRINITSLIRRHFAHGGKYEYCSAYYVNPDGWFLPVSQHCCTCHSLFNDYISKPCIDYALKYPSQCQSNQIFSYKKLKSAETFGQVTTGCYVRETLKVIKDLCESVQIESIFQILPVSKTYTNEKFKNIFCTMCNRHVKSRDEIYYRISDENYMYTHIPFGKPWDINMHCDNVLDFNNCVTLFDLLKKARDMKCNIIFTPKENIPLPRPCEIADPWRITRCNVTGYWTSYDPYIEWACEQSDHDLVPFMWQYKNVFCYICNPKFANNSVISSCNETGIWRLYSPNIERACLIFPKVDTLYPFKNIFCKLCNVPGSAVSPGGKTTPKVTVPTSPTPETRYPFTFRNVFSLSQFDDAIGLDSRDGCAFDQIYDVYKHVCRNITCYPGKRLVNDTCIPVLMTTSKLRYILAFQMERENRLNQTENSGEIWDLNYLHIIPKIMLDIKRWLVQSFTLKDNELKFYDFIALGNLPCKKIITNETDVKILLNIDLFISGFVDRLKTETFLMDFIDGNFSVDLNGIKLISVKSKEAMYLPSMLNKADLDDKCFLGSSNFSFFPFEYYKSTFVDKVMTCKQIELESSEFQLDNMKMEMKFVIQNTDLDFDQYKKMTDGKARVCIDILSTKYPIHVDPTNKALSILTLICVSVSLLCLLITFITYCLFSPLRTLPGKNLMLLIFTMFCAQVCFVAGYRQITIQTACVVKAILSHLFWLATFSCMNTCTIHMYRVFGKSSLLVSSLHENNRIFLWYFLYSYGVPVTFCTINIVVYLAISSGTFTGYGGKFCFIDNRISFIVTFIVPVVSICVSNIVLFSLTVYHLRHTPKIQSNKSNQREVYIYIRLFALTGITWILQIVDSFLELSVFSFIVTIFIGLQGLYIMLSYICTSRVARLYKILLLKSKKNEKEHSDSKRSTTSTTASMLPLSSTPFNRNSTNL